MYAGRKTFWYVRSEVSSNLMLSNIYAKQEGKTRVDIQRFGGIYRLHLQDRQLAK
jgi:hypothetical protein